MDKLQKDLDDLNSSIRDLESQIEKEKEIAEESIKQLNAQLSQIRQDKRSYAAKNDFESVQNCRRKEENLKFKITSKWNRHSILKNDLIKLKRKKDNLDYQIKLEKDKIKRNDENLKRMDKVLKNYRKTQNLKQAAIDSDINPEHVEQWYEWGKNDYNQTYSYFHSQIIEIDEFFKSLEAQKLKKQMDDVVDAYRKTDSLKEASRMAGVSYDTVMYWYEWGSRGFGSENTYFFKKIDS
ncbi:hypothetical protein [Methanobrevibacter sp.]|uniref:hypothetical protein n=1 Tax=Methanobrevibacter sp. TaxID=66852 RepID=UPI0026E0FA14|nr:hypothetical protein [Methanobrevibacter sp.]MDO5859862.1 hypothetical protein [Methanobrevibacter sp.]